jgi:CheY-like chemotaxis protein
MEEAKKILVVEDESMIRRALVDKLQEEEFEVIEARDGKEGLEKAILENPNIVLLDIVMPEMDGITVSQKMADIPQTENIPIIFLTNLSDSTDVQERIKNKQYEFLVKSNWDITDVVKKVKEKIR